MTCIIAIKNPSSGTVIVGGDSRRSLGGLSVSLPFSAGKIVSFSGFVVGHTGAGRIRNLTSRLGVKFGKDGPRKGFNLEEELLAAIVPSFKAVAQKNNALTINNGISDFGGQLLIAFADQICLLGSDLSVTPIDAEFWAIGSGQQLALGSLASTKNLMTARERVLEALRVAAAFDPSVGAPFVLKETIPLPRLIKKK